MSDPDLIEMHIALCSTYPQRGTPTGNAWERGARQGYQWALQDSPSPSPAPPAIGAVSVEEDWSDIYARDLIRRLWNHASDASNPLPGSIYYACNEAAALLARLKDAPVAPGHTDLMVTPESLDVFIEASPQPTAPPSPVEHAELIAHLRETAAYQRMERDLPATPQGRRNGLNELADMNERAAAALASLTEDMRKLNDLYRETCRGVAAQVKRAEQAEAERDTGLIEKLRAVADDPEEDKRSWLGQTCHEAASALASLTAENKRLENALASLWDTPETTGVGVAAVALIKQAEAERDAAVKRAEAQEADNEGFRKALKIAVEERDAARAEVKRLREALEEAEGELVNLLPHIPQACIPGHAGFIDAHVDEAISIIRTALAKTQEPEMKITEEMRETFERILREEIDLAKPGDLAFFEFQVPRIVGRISQAVAPLIVEECARENEIETPPEIIEAGVSAWYEWFESPETSVEILVERIYRAMAAIAKTQETK